MKYLFAGVTAFLSLAIMLTASQAQDKKGDEKKTEETKTDAKPKYTIKDVMQKAQKGPLAKKVYSGGASKEEKDELVDLYTALSANTPPKGDAKDWKERTTAMVDAAKAVAKMEDAKSLDTLKKVAQACPDCHKMHK